MIVPVLSNDRLLLRAVEPQDFKPFAAFLGSARSRFLGGPKGRTEAWFALASIAGHRALRGFGNFAVVRRGEKGAIGTMGPWQPEGWPEPELAWTLCSEGAEGRGLVFEAMSRLRAWADTTLGWTTAVSYIHPGNDRSIRLAERLGARPDPRAPRKDAESFVWRHAFPEAPA